MTIARVESGKIQNLDMSDISPCMETNDFISKYDNLNKAIEKLESEDDIINEKSPHDAELQYITRQLEQRKKTSIELIGTHNTLIEKIEKHESSAFHRIFTPNREKKLAGLRKTLSKKFSEAAELDLELERLERQSFRLSEMCQTAAGSPSEFNIQNKRQQLCQEKQELIDDIFQSVPVPNNVRCLEIHIAKQKSDIKACESIRRQTEELMSLFRQALHLLRTASAEVLSDNYNHTMAAFISGPYTLALESSRLVSLASMMVQPESKRRYAEYAPLIADLRLPKFPSIIRELSRPGMLAKARTNTMNMKQKLVKSENIVLKMQQIVSKHTEILDKWKDVVEEEYSEAQHRRDHLSQQLEKCADQFIRRLSVS